MTRDRMQIKYEIAMLKFQQYGLTTDSVEWRDLQQKIFSLQEEAVHSYCPYR